MDDVWHPSEQWSISERRVWQERRLIEVVNAAWEHAPALRERLGAAGLKPHKLTLESLSKLPVLRGDEYQEAQRSSPPFAGWLGVGIQDTARLFRSPGPILNPEGRDDDYWRFAPALFAAGIRPGDVVVNTLSYHLTPAGHMMDGALRALRCAVVPSGPGNPDVQAELLGALPITGFIGTPTFLGAVLEAARQAGITPQLRHAFVIEELMPEALRQRLGREFGVPVRQGYGTADVGSIGYECSAGNGLHITRETVVELINPDTGRASGIGEVGEIVVTALTPTYPLMRLGTGDLAFMGIGECACGRTGPRLDRIVGRVDDAVRVRGTYVHPFEVDGVIARYPEITRYQGVVTRAGDADEFVLRVELAPDTAPSPLIRDRLRQGVAAGLRLGADVEVVPTGTLADAAKKIIDLRTRD